MSSNPSISDSNDVLTVFDINEEFDVLYCGETPDGIEEKCLQFCIDFIGKHWSKLTIKDVHVQRINGGLVNQFYRVTIPGCKHEPNDVGLKIYQDKMVQDKCVDGRSNDVIILKAISDLGIGPKIYGLTSNIAIFDFIESEYFSVEHQKNEKLLRELMSCLVKFHNMDLPTIKNGNFPDKYLREGLDKAYDKLHLFSIAKEMNLKLLSSMCLRKEYSAIFDILENDLKTERVFCHNDFRSQNILVSKKDSRLYLCDVEYSAYGIRPSDLSTFLMEWGVGPLRYRIPDDETIDYVVKMYLEEYDKIEPGHSEKPENSLKQVSNEIKVSFLRSYLFLISFMAEKEQSFPDTLPFDYKENLMLCEKILEFYVKAKERFIQGGVFKSF